MPACDSFKILTASVVSKMSSLYASGVKEFETYD